jgi:hypothetical protein
MNEYEGLLGDIFLLIRGRKKKTLCFYLQPTLCLESCWVKT